MEYTILSESDEGRYVYVAMRRPTWREALRLAWRLWCCPRGYSVLALINRGWIERYCTQIEPERSFDAPLGK